MLMSPINGPNFHGSVNKIPVLEGNFFVSQDRSHILSTILGSCIAVCIFDIQQRIGGMNHFLLAEPDSNSDFDHLALERFGSFAMEQLINEMMKSGASRFNMKAHIYGGGSIKAGMERIGIANRNFATRFLQRDGIEITKEDTGGRVARRVDFRIAGGQTRCRSIPIEEYAPVVPAEPRKLKNNNSGDLELF